MKYGGDLYVPDAKTHDNPYVPPLRASNAELTGLPPALVITAENDPLRDEGEAYARKLKDAGVEVTAIRYNGMTHDFALLNAIRHVPSVEAAIAQASAVFERIWRSTSCRPGQRSALPGIGCAITAPTEIANID